MIKYYYTFVWSSIHIDAINDNITEEGSVCVLSELRLRLTNCGPNKIGGQILSSVLATLFLIRLALNKVAVSVVL